MKGVVFFAAVFMAAISFCARADAAVELCGAALSARSVEGDVVADTDHGWFEWKFPNTVLTSHVDEMSEPLYVSFPSGTVVRHA